MVGSDVARVDHIRRVEGVDHVEDHVDVVGALKRTHISGFAANRNHHDAVSFQEHHAVFQSLHDHLERFGSGHRPGIAVDGVHHAERTEQPSARSVFRVHTEGRHGRALENVDRPSFLPHLVGSGCHGSGAVGVTEDHLVTKRRMLEDLAERTGQNSLVENLGRTVNVLLVRIYPHRSVKALMLCHGSSSPFGLVVRVVFRVPYILFQVYFFIARVNAQSRS